MNQNGMSKFTKLFEIGLSVIIAPIPNAIIGFVMFEPIRTPSERSLDFFNIPITAVVNSGSAVANPIINNPKNDCSIPRVFEKLNVVSTTAFADS